MRTDFKAFHDPAAVALVGASADPLKWGNWYVPGLLAGRHRRTVVFVNDRRPTIGGVEAIATLAECPVTPDLVVICVPPAAVPAAVDDALAAGASGLLVITAGIDQMVGNGTEQQLAERVRAAGARMIGPNCVGLIDTASELRIQWCDPQPGSLAIVAHSGRVATDLAGAATECGLGVSRLVSLGNSADAGVAEAIEDLVGHEPTRVVGLYVEDFGDGRAVVDAIGRLADTGRRTLVIAVGASGAASAAARSHTGSLTSSLDVVDAACRAAGAIRVRSTQEAIDAARLLARPQLPRGRRLAIVGDSGGGGAIAADLAAAADLDVPPLPSATQTTLAAALDYNASAVNPVDIGGAGAIDYDDFSLIVDASASSGAVDMVLLSSYFGAYCLDYPDNTEAEVAVARAICASSRRHHVPVVVQNHLADSPPLRAFRDGGVPTFQSVDRAITALGYASQAGSRTPRALQRTSPPIPSPAGLGARDLLAASGVAFPPSNVASDRAGVLDGARALRAPYALKADWIDHKTDVGGVVLNLRDEAALAAAHDDMAARLGRGRYRVEEMDQRPHVVEMLIGARRDPAFGPVVTVGAGGTSTEVQRDSVVELGPLDEDLAHDMLRRLRCWPLLNGWRGAPSVDVVSLAKLVVAIGDLMVSGSDLREIELNPVRAAPDGLMVVDALVVA